MEEAEALCTRLGIMVSGTLRCLGSGQRLRTRYAKEYQIEASLVPGHPGARGATLAVLDKELPGYCVLEEQGNQLRISVPLAAKNGEKNTLSILFALLQSNKEAVGIANYSISQTSLEQIFNGFAQTQEEETLLAKGEVE